MIDTHAHLDACAEPADALVERAREVGVTRILAVGTHGAAWREKVLHSVFEGPGLRLCASDGPDSEPMKGCA